MSTARPAAGTRDATCGYLLPAGTSQYDVLEWVRALGFTAVRMQPRGAQQFLTYWFDRAPATQPTDEDAQPIWLRYEEDPQLGQRVLWVSAPDPALHTWLTTELGAVDLTDALSRAHTARSPAEQVATLGPLACLLSGLSQLPADAHDLLRSRLNAAEPAVRSAALLALSYLPFPELVALLSAHAHDPVLSDEIKRQLALRGAAETASAADTRRRIEDEIAAAPEKSDAYFRHAQRLIDLQQPAFALAEAQLALALARREGRPLGEPLALLQGIRPQLSVLPATWLPYIAQRLSSLLQLDRPHVVVEVADQLLAVLGSSIAAAPLQIALALAHRRLGRSTLALVALQSARDALPVPPESATASMQAAAAQHVAAELTFLWAQLTIEVDPRATEPALHAAQKAQALLPPDTLIPAIDAVQDLLVAALLTFFPASLRTTPRTQQFFCLQTLAAADRTDEALAMSVDLLEHEPAAADIWLARAALLIRCDRAQEALHACVQADQSLTALDRLLEDIDPLALVRLRQATAHAHLAHADHAHDCIRQAIALDPRVVTRVVDDPALEPLLTESSELSEHIHAALQSLDEPDPYPRTAARHEAAACLRQLPRQTALWLLLLDFFSAGLLLLDRAPVDRRAAAGMTLLASLEAQLDLLTASGDERAQSQPIYVAMATMAEALGL